MLSRLFYCLPLLGNALLAQAQVTTNPTQALATRDTLLRQAEQLRLQAQQQSSFFRTKRLTGSPRRVVVQGVLSSTLPANEPRPRWRQVTVQRRNGRLQQHPTIRNNQQLLLDEYRLNGYLVQLPPVPAALAGQPGRHVGYYLSSGFVLLDRREYVLPRLSLD